MTDRTTKEEKVNLIRKLASRGRGKFKPEKLREELGRRGARRAIYYARHGGGLKLEPVREGRTVAAYIVKTRAGRPKGSQPDA